LLLKLSGTIITKSNKLPENLRLKVFSGNKLENAIKLRFFCLFSYKNLTKIPNCLDHTLFGTRSLKIE